jgi:hypothetical protein
MAGPEVNPDEERDDALGRLLEEIRTACNTALERDQQVWQLTGVVGAVAGIAAADVRGGAGATQLHRDVDLLNKLVAQLTADGGGGP